MMTVQAHKKDPEKVPCDQDGFVQANDCEDMNISMTVLHNCLL